MEQPDVPPEDAARLRATMAAYGRPVRQVGYWREGQGFNARCGLGRLEVTQQFLQGDRDAEECALAHEAGHRGGWERCPPSSFGSPCRGDTLFSQGRAASRWYSGQRRCLYARASRVVG